MLEVRVPRERHEDVGAGEERDGADDRVHEPEATGNTGGGRSGWMRLQLGEEPRLGPGEVENERPPLTHGKAGDRLVIGGWAFGM